MILSHYDQQSDLWRRLNDHFNVLLNDCRTELEKDLDERSSCVIRGKIKILKQLISMDSKAGEDPTEDIE